MLIHRLLNSVREPGHVCIIQTGMWVDEIEEKLMSYNVMFYLKVQINVHRSGCVVRFGIFINNLTEAW